MTVCTTEQRKGERNIFDDDIFIDDGNAENIAQKIFAPDVKDRPKIALQFFIYDLLVKDRNEAKDRNMCNCVYSTSRLFKELPEAVPVNRTFFFPGNMV